MKTTRVLDFVLLVLKIIIPVALAAILILFSYTLIARRIDDVQHVGEEGYHSGYGLTLFLSWIFAAVCNLAVAILSTAGLVIAYLNKSSPKQKKTLTQFWWLFIAPVINEALVVAVGAFAVNFIT